MAVWVTCNRGWRGWRASVYDILVWVAWALCWCSWCGWRASVVSVGSVLWIRKIIRNGTVKKLILTYLIHVTQVLTLTATIKLLLQNTSSAWSWIYIMSFFVFLYTKNLVLGTQLSGLRLALGNHVYAVPLRLLAMRWTLYSYHLDDV